MEMDDNTAIVIFGMLCCVTVTIWIYLGTHRAYPADYVDCVGGRVSWCSGKGCEHPEVCMAEKRNP